jgi:hypothetical protein
MSMEIFNAVLTVKLCLKSVLSSKKFSYRTYCAHCPITPSDPYQVKLSGIEGALPLIKFHGVGKTGA